MQQECMLEGWSELLTTIQMGGYNHWTGLLDWTTGLTQTAKYTSFGAE